MPENYDSYLVNFSTRDIGESLVLEAIEAENPTPEATETTTTAAPTTTTKSTSRQTTESPQSYPRDMATPNG